jgi:hypothetical protein
MNIRTILLISFLKFKIKDVYGIIEMNNFTPSPQHNDSKGVFMKYQKNGIRIDTDLEDVNRNYMKKYYIR